MLQALSSFLSDMAKFFLGIFARKPVVVSTPPQVQPSPTPTPAPSAGGTIAPHPIPQPIGPQPGPQSAWWEGTWAQTQPFGCTHSQWEPHNPNHPTCDHWHDGVDYGLPCGTPIFAAGDFVVAHVDDPAMVPAFGVAALGLIAGVQGKPEGHDVWLLHMHDYAVKFGDSVRRGTLLGHSGTRGLSTGCHLHFMVTPRGGNYFSSIDPTAWINERI